MKIAVTSTGQNLDATVDPRFGRAAYILIVDAESLNYEFIDLSLIHISEPTIPVGISSMPSSD